MPIPGSIKRITNPENSSQFVDLRIVDEIMLKHGRGGIFKRHRIRFLNREPNDTRVVRTERVFYRAADPEGNPVDGPGNDEEQYLDVEIIERWATKHGKGGIYKKRTNVTENEIEIDNRETHIVRIHGKDEEGEDDPDVWIDVKRTDSFWMKHGRGGIQRRQRVFVGWVEPEFDEASEDLQLIEGPGESIDPPWRLDPLQEIINVHWKDEAEGWIFPINIVSRASLGFHQTGRDGFQFFAPMGHEYRRNDGTGLPGHGSLTGMINTYLTGFTYMWSTQTPEMEFGSFGPWIDRSANHPIPIGFVDVDTVYTGLPSLPQERPVAGVQYVGTAVVSGANSTNYAPTAQWEDPTGEQLLDEPLAPNNIPWRRGTSATIRMIGVAASASGLSFDYEFGIAPDGTEAIIPAEEMGFTGPGAGLVTNSGEYPATFEELEISLAGVTVTKDGVIYKPVAVSHQPGSRPTVAGGHLMPPRTGIIWVLCKPADDPEWFP
jgi:hypothetical protein